MPRQPAVRGRRHLARGEARPVGERERAVQHAGEVAAVVRLSARRAMRELAHHVPTPQRHAIDAGLRCGLLDDALDEVRHFRPSGAAVRAGWRGVRHEQRHATVHRRDAIDARDAVADVRGGDHRTGIRQIGAHGGVQMDAQREEVAVAIEPELSRHDAVASVVLGEKRLAARRHPLDRPAERLRREEQGRVLGVDRRARQPPPTSSVSRRIRSARRRARALAARRPPGLVSATSSYRRPRGVVRNERDAILERVRDGTVVDVPASTTCAARASASSTLPSSSSWYSKQTLSGISA
jgi:hypothetical protein